MKDKSELQNAIECLKNKYEFDGMYHFTNFTNLKSIFNAGFLYSRHDCTENKYIFKDAASKEVIHKTELEIKKCARFYYRDQSYTLYANEGIKRADFITDSHCPIPVYLVFNEDLILDDNTYFSDGNAKSEYTSICNSSVFFKSMDWDSIFSIGSLKGTYRERLETKRKRQAELLSTTPVSLKNLKSIYFRSIADKRRAINLFGNRDYFLVDCKKFSSKNFQTCKEEYENNFITDYKYKILNQRNSRGALLLKINFNKENIRDYKLSYDVVDKRGNWRPCNNVDTRKSKLLNGIIDDKQVDLVFRDFNDEWKRINIYLNGILSIELDVSEDGLYKRQNLLKSIKLDLKKKDADGKLVVKVVYRDESYIDLDHYLELCDENMKVIQKYEILLLEQDLNLNKDIIITGVKKSAKFISYLIDGFAYDTIEIK